MDAGLAEMKDFGAGFGEPARQRFLALARAEDEVFAAQVEAAVRRAVSDLAAPRSNSYNVKMLVSEFIPDEFGNLTRELRAIEVGGPDAAERDTCG